MKLKIFVVFHKGLYTECYQGVPEEDMSHITFYGVKDAQVVAGGLYEKDLPVYMPELQEKSYNEGSCLYHLYKNNLYMEHEYIGIFQYDMIFCRNTIRGILDHATPNVIFYLDFFQDVLHTRELQGGQTIITTGYDDLPSGLDSYNKFFGTNYTLDNVVGNGMPICNCFIVHQTIFKKMMSWMEQYFRADMFPVRRTTDGHDMDPGHMIEALTSMFLSLEVMSSCCEFRRLDLSHQNYRLKVY